MATVQALLRGEPGGLRDLLWLFPLRLFTGDTSLFATDHLRDVVVGILNTTAMDALLIAVASVLMSLGLGKRERQVSSALTLDIAASGWLVWLLVQTVFGLGCALAQWTPPGDLTQRVQAAAGVAWLGHWLLSLRALRNVLAQLPPPTEPPAAASEAPHALPESLLPPMGPLRRARPLGALLLASLALLAFYDLTWLRSQSAKRPRPGKLAPEIVAPRLDGSGDFRLSAERGHPVLVDFWATWCGPCKMLAPRLTALKEKFGAQGLTVVGITTDDAEKAALFAERHQMKYPVVVDDAGDTSKAYGIGSLPTMLLVDKRGVVREVFIGFDPSGEAKVEALIKSLLAEQGTPKP